MGHKTKPKSRIVPEEVKMTKEQWKRVNKKLTAKEAESLKKKKRKLSP